MQHRRLFGGGGLRVDDRRQRLIVDTYAFQGVFGQVTALGDHDRHRLADVAHLVHGDAPMFHRLAHADREWQGPTLDVLTDEYAVHAFHQQRFGEVHGSDARMGMG